MTYSVAPNHFKQGLKAKKKQPGMWLTLESPNVTEIMAGAGYDWLLLDMEHTSLDPSQVADHIRAVKGTTTELMLRVPWSDPVMFKRLLDTGIRSFMVPFVQSADEARRAVAATRYPPHGIRGVSGTSRATGFGRIKEYGQRYLDAQCIVVQIETPKAVAAIAEIGAVDGVDGIFVGPNDLAANMGLFGQTGAPEVKAAIAQAVKMIEATGKAPGILNFVPAEARELFRMGYDFVAVGGDMSLIARRSEALLAEINAP